MDEILWCDHSNETSSAVLSHDAIYLVCSSNCCVVDEIHRCDHSNETSSAGLSHAAIYLVRGSSRSMDEILWFDHTHKTSSVVRLHFKVLSGI